MSRERSPTANRSSCGDNLYLTLDLSRSNLPEGTLIRAGGALLSVTPMAHDGCKKWVQRFGLCAMQLNLDPAYRAQRLRGLYLRVVEEGRVRVGDPAIVVSRGQRARPAASPEANAS